MATDEEKVKSIILGIQGAAQYIEPLNRNGFLSMSKLLLSQPESISYKTSVPLNIVNQVVFSVSQEMMAYLTPIENYDLVIPPRFDDPVIDSAVKIPDSTLVEIVGEARSGKTNVVFQLATNARRQNPSRPVVLISTEGKVPTNRLFDYADNDEEITSGIFIYEADTVTKLNEIVQNTLPQEFYFNQSRLPPSMVIIDSIASAIRLEFEIGAASERTQLLFNIATTLKWLAGEGKSVIIVTNQVSANMDLFATTDWVPALGISWSFCLNVRIIIRRLESKHEVADPNQSKVSGPGRGPKATEPPKMVNVRTFTTAISPLNQGATCKFVITKDKLVGI